MVSKFKQTADFFFITISVAIFCILNIVLPSNFDSLFLGSKPAAVHYW